MAEAWFQYLTPDHIQVVSAGSDATGYVHQRAIEVMKEVGIDLSKNVSKSIDPFLNHQFDFIITVCDDAAETCPSFPGRGERIHWSIEDPAEFIGSEDEVKVAFRGTRDLLRQRISEFLGRYQRIDL
jgi:arsenate reductase